MNPVKQSFEVIKETDILKKIELCGRTCYQSFDKITKESSKKFVEKLIARGHESVLEHVWLKLNLTPITYSVFYKKYQKEVLSKGLNSFILCNEEEKSIVGNIRAIRQLTKDYGFYFIELNENYPVLFPDRGDIPLSCRYEVYQDTITVKFITNRNVSHQLVRHEAEISQESQRYVIPSSKDKDINEGMKFIIPVQFLEDGKLNKHKDGYEVWENACKDSEFYYKGIQEAGYPPQVCRNALNSSIKTEIVMTCTKEQWRHIFDERLASGADPQTRSLLGGFYQEVCNSLQREPIKTNQGI